MKRNSELLNELCQKIEELCPLIDELEAYAELHTNNPDGNVYVNVSKLNPTITVRKGKAYIDFGFIKTVHLMLDKRYAKDFIKYINWIRTQKEILSEHIHDKLRSSFFILHFSF